MENRSRTFLMIILSFLLPSAAYANAGTGFFFPGLVHVLIGNLIIGLIETFFIQKVFKVTVAYGIIILANYISSIIGYILAIAAFSDIDLLSLSALPISLALMFVASAVIEWPFFSRAVNQGRFDFSTSSLRYSIYAQCASYILLVPYHFLLFDTGRLPSFVLVASDLQNVASLAYQHRLRPVSMGGGGGSFLGFSVPPHLSATSEGYYAAKVSRDSVVCVAMDVETTRTVATVVVDSIGELHSWDIFFQPEERPFDEYVSHLGDIAAAAHQYRMTGTPTVGEKSYIGFTLPKEFSPTKFRSYRISPTRDSIMLAMEIYNRGTSVSAILDSTGQLKSWQYPREWKNIPIRSDLFVNDKMRKLADEAYQYRTRPLSRGGGGGSYIGFSVPEKLSVSRNHHFFATVSKNSVVLAANYRNDPMAIVSVVLDSLAKLHSWKWNGEFYY